MNLDGTVMYVGSTDDRGVVGAKTRLYFIQKRSRVFARYAGGRVKRGQIHCGHSVCEVEWPEEAGLRVIEHFTWSTRSGGGTNILAQIG